MFTEASDCPLSSITLQASAEWVREIYFWQGGPLQLTYTLSGNATFSWTRISLASLVAKPGLPAKYLPAIPKGCFVVVKSSTGQADFSVLIGPQDNIENAYTGRTAFNPEYYDLEDHEYTYRAIYGGGGINMTETAPGRYTLYTTEPTTPNGNEAAVASRNSKYVELELDDDGKVKGLAFGGSVALVSPAVPEHGRPAVYRVTVPPDAAEGVPIGVAGDGHHDISFTVNSGLFEYDSDFFGFLHGSALGGDGLQGWMQTFSPMNDAIDEYGNPAYPVFFTAFERRSATVFDVAMAEGVTLSAVETAYIQGVTGRPKSAASFSVGAAGISYPDPNAAEGETPAMFEPPAWTMLHMNIDAEIEQFSPGGSWNNDATDVEYDDVPEGAFRLTLTLS